MNCTDRMFFSLSVDLARPSNPAYSTTFMRSESPSSKCAKLHTVAASSNRDHAAQSFYYCLFAPHVYAYCSSRISRSWWIAHSMQRERRDCNSTWVRCNSQPINSNKTAYMVLTSTNSWNWNSNFYEWRQNTANGQCQVSLAVIDHKLLRKPQISSLCGKLFQAIGVLCKLGHFPDSKILQFIYFSVFHLHLPYCIIDWEWGYKTVIQPVQVVENWILKYMTFTQRRSNAKYLFKLLKNSNFWFVPS